MEADDDYSSSKVVDFEGENDGSIDIGSSYILEQSRTELISEDSINLSELV
jgi:hypothetical protein